MQVYKQKNKRTHTRARTHTQAYRLQKCLQLSFKTWQQALQLILQ